MENIQPASGDKKLCPHCKLEVDAKASRCPHCHGKIYVWSFGRKLILGLVVFSLVIYFIAAVSGGSSPSAPSPAPSTFMANAQVRFASIKEVSPELASIECNSDCSTLYFNYSNVPNDLDYVIRGNASTFAKFKNDETGSGNITVIAQKNNIVLLSCKATTLEGKGRVIGCK